MKTKTAPGATPMTADDVIAHLDLAPHPEGGWYRRTWSEEGAGRPSGTCIYYLLRADEVSHWHRVDATEIWLWHAGAPLVLSQAVTLDGTARDEVLGPDLGAGAFPQIIVPEGTWQSARSDGDWTLVSCTVSPGFRFEGFELAPAGVDIPRV